VPGPTRSSEIARTIRQIILRPNGASSQVAISQLDGKDPPCRSQRKYPQPVRVRVRTSPRLFASPVRRGETIGNSVQTCGNCRDGGDLRFCNKPRSVSHVTRPGWKGEGRLKRLPGLDGCGSSRSVERSPHPKCINTTLLITAVVLAEGYGGAREMVCRQGYDKLDGWPLRGMESASALGFRLGNTRSSGRQDFSLALRRGLCAP